MDGGDIEMDHEEDDIIDSEEEDEEERSGPEYIGSDDDDDFPSEDTTQRGSHAQFDAESHFEKLFGPNWQITMHQLQQSSVASACTVQWERGSIAFSCKQCQFDQTCVVCPECFFGADHEGHDTNLIRTVNGCCDCGDSSSWNPKGFCTKHCGVSGNEDSAEALQHLPEDIQTRAKQVIPALVAQLLADMELMMGPSPQGEPHVVRGTYKWFQTVALLSPGLRYLMTQALSPHLEVLLKRCVALKGDVLKAASGFFMSLFQQSPSFKLAFSVACLQNYEEVTINEASRGESLSSLSVQLYSVPEVALVLCRDYGAIPIFCNILSKWFDKINRLVDNGGTEPDRRDVNPPINAAFTILHDLKYVFYDQGVCSFVLKDPPSRRAILGILTATWPAQRRKSGDHVLYEWDPQMIIPRVETMAVECLRNLEEAGRNLSWEDGLPWYEELFQALEGPGLAADEFTLYCRLHRFIVNSLPLQSLQDAALQVGGGAASSPALQNWLSLITPSRMKSLLRPALRSLIFAAEITKGSWVRNGDMLRVVCKHYYLDRGWQSEDIMCVQISVIMAALHRQAGVNDMEPAQLIWDVVSEGTLKDLVRDEDVVKEWTKMFKGPGLSPEIPPYDLARAEFFWEIVGRIGNDAWLLDVADGRVGAKGVSKPAAQAALARWFLHILAGKSLTAADLEGHLPDGWTQHPALDKALQSVATGRKVDNGALKFELKAECWKQFDALHVCQGESTLLHSSDDTVEIASKQGSDLCGPLRTATDPSCQAWRDIIMSSLVTDTFLQLLFFNLRARLLLMGGGGPCLGQFAPAASPTRKAEDQSGNPSNMLPLHLLQSTPAMAGLANALQRLGEAALAAGLESQGSKPGKIDFLAGSLCWMLKTLDLIHNSGPSTGSNLSALNTGISALLDRSCRPPRGFGGLYRDRENGAFVAEAGTRSDGQAIFIGPESKPVNISNQSELSTVSFWDPNAEDGVLGTWDEELVGLVDMIPESGSLLQLCKGCCTRARQLRPKQSSASSASPTGSKDSQASKIEAKKKAMAARQKAMMAAMAAKQQKFAEDVDDMEVEDEVDEKGETAEKILYCDVCRGAGTVDHPVGLLSRSARSKALHLLGYNDGKSTEDIAVSSCGHMLHSDCFDKHRQHQSQRTHNDILHLSRPGPDCVACPMCRSVVSAWVPILPSAGPYWGVADPEASSSPSSLELGAAQQEEIRKAVGKLIPLTEEEKTVDRVSCDWMRACKAQVMTTAALSPARIVPGGEAPPLHVAMLRVWSFLFSKPSTYSSDNEGDLKSIFLYAVSSGNGQPISAPYVRDTAKSLTVRKAQSLEAQFHENTDKTTNILEGLLQWLIFVAWVVTSLFKFEDKDYNLLALLPTHLEQSIPALWHLIFGATAEWSLSALLDSAAALTTSVPSPCRDLGGLVPFPELPKRYIDLIKHVYGQKCQNCGVVPPDPILCLACGAIICGKKRERANTTPCNPASPHDPPTLRRLSGLCQRHAEVCGAGQGLFLSPYDTYVIAVSGACNGIWETPYADVYNEPTSATNTLNLTLDTQRWERLRTVYTTATIAADVVRNNRKSGRYVAIDL